MLFLPTVSKHWSNEYLHITLWHCCVLQSEATVCVGTCVLTTTALIPLCWIMSACQPPYLACQVTVVVFCYNIFLSHDQLWATSMIGRNAVTWLLSLLNADGRPCDIAISHGHVTMHHCKLSLLISINLRCVTTVLIIKNAAVSKSQNVKYTW